jgi:hypothetical protein
MTDTPPILRPPGVSRRGFLQGTATAAGALAASQAAAQEGASASAAIRTLTLTVNGERRSLPVEPRTTLAKIWLSSTEAKG